MSLQELLDVVRKNNPKADLDLIKLAYEFAENAHRDQKRITGEPYIEHVLATAMILAKEKLDIPTIIAGLLHDVPEDTKYTLKDIEKEFGSEVASLVAGVTNLSKLKYRGLERYIENLRKMFVAMAQDIRVIFIKFATRLHNLETLAAHPPEKRIRIAKECLEIYAPIASRLGMSEIKWQLEDLSFKNLFPKEYEHTTKLMEEKLPKIQRVIKEAEKIIRRELKKANIEILMVQKRTKHAYRIYQKLKKYDQDINRIYDLMAFRFIVPTISDCYAALGIIHQIFKPLKGRIKDYIANPKPNGYQSLHSTVFSPEGEVFELQIRTPEMHTEAMYGIAAHWHYAEKGDSKIPERKLHWVKELTKWQKELEENKQYLETLKLDALQNRIFVFTPKGEVIDLPEESTPVDFAYYVHTEIGNKCSRALVNDQLVSLDTSLKSGDVIEIITDKKRKGPSADWLKFVKTNTARAKIKSQLRSGLLSWLKQVVPGK